MKAKDIRKGTVIEFKGAPHSVMEFHHRTPGNLRAFVQVRLRNLLTGNQCEEKISSTHDVEVADVFHEEATFLYADGDDYHFMNSRTYEQFSMSSDALGTATGYLQDGMVIQASFYQDNPISIQLPKTVVLTIEETEPELKGATASGSPKPAVTDSGVSLNVPPFIKIGDKITVDTDTGEYIGRAND